MPGVSLRGAPTLDVPALEERDGLVPMLLGQRLQHAPIDLLGARPFLLELRRSDVVRDKGGDRTAQHLPIAGGPRAPWRQRGGDIRSWTRGTSGGRAGAIGVRPAGSSGSTPVPHGPVAR